MTRDEIINLMKRDGAWDYFDLEGDSVGILMLVTLCQDVAAAEREACAKVCEADGLLWGQRYAAAIRARGETK